MNRTHRWSALVLAALLAACTGTQQPTGRATAGVGGGATAQPSPTPARTPGPGEFRNPVLEADFPDPYAAKFGDTYYAYATGGGGKHIQVARSRDLVKWQMLADALPKIPEWSGGSTWAPEVWRTAAGYVMYYTLSAPDLKTPNGGNAQCVSLAVSRSPAGPFVDPNRKPVVCQPELGGSIDATPFQDRDGKRYLAWKNDGNCCDVPTRFYIQELTADGLRLVGAAKDMGVVNDAEWEKPVNSRIEAPELVLQGGTYYLFYSGSAHDTEFYAVGYATSKSVTGPYTDAPENPILKSRGRAAGPGHNTIVRGPDGQLWTLYHAWDADAIGSSGRKMWLDELVFENGKAVIKGPDDAPQPAPKAAP